jgi:hypothetical protein
VLDATGIDDGPVHGFLRPASGFSVLPDGAFPPQGSSIPLLGFAQAGAGGFFDDGGFPAGQGWDVVEFPAAPSQKAGVYALEVQGESMMPLYRDGDVLIVEPGAQVRRGDRVVVKTTRRRSDGQGAGAPEPAHASSCCRSIPNTRTARAFDVDWIARRRNGSPASSGPANRNPACRDAGSWNRRDRPGRTVNQIRRQA